MTIPTAISSIRGASALLAILCTCAASASAQQAAADPYRQVAGVRIQLEIVDSLPNRRGAMLLYRPHGPSALLIRRDDLNPRYLLQAASILRRGLGRSLGGPGSEARVTITASTSGLSDAERRLVSRLQAADGAARNQSLVAGYGRRRSIVLTL
jgi:hypothetical protein